MIPKGDERDTMDDDRGTRQFIRLAALKPAAADAYPYLPVRMWTTADRLAALVARYRGISREALDRAHRILSDQHFMFRNGGPAPA
jgi:hypothetical protein